MKSCTTFQTGEKAHNRAAVSSTDSQQADTTIPGVRPQVLLVDDDLSVRESLALVLEESGYAVVQAADGQKAIDLASCERVDLVLLDLNMPVKNGWDTFEQLTRDHPLLPIVIATARPNQFFTALNAGVGALLEKPLEIPQLLRVIGRLIAESPEKRLSRLAGQNEDFDYQSSASGKSSPTRPGDQTR